MRKNHFKILSSEIKKEIKTLKHLVNEKNDFFNRNKGTDYELEKNFHKLRVYGSILHDFYTCIEKIFRKIAIEMDEELPKGLSWHSELLERMNLNIEDVRIKVIKKDMKRKLYEYLRFRDVFRNVYGFDLKWEKMKHLVIDLEKVFNEIESSIEKFLNFIIKLS